MVSVGSRIAEKTAAAGHALDAQAEAQIPDGEGGIWSAVDQLLRRNTAGAMDQEASAQMPSQFRAYYSNPVVDRRTNRNPLEVWQTMKGGLEHVYELAMEYLFIPCTSVASERLFSHAGCVATQRRSRLSPTHLSQLTFLRSVPKADWFKVPL